jgi:predicted nucleic acid-binding protein
VIERVGLLDTGPLVSFLAAGLEHHAWAVEQWKRLRPPLLTCEPVVTEAAFLLKRERQPRSASNRSKRISEPSCGGTAMDRMSLADACVVRFSEIHGAAEVLTLACVR